MRLRNCLGMIWSVSTLVRSRGIARDVSVLNGSMLGSDLLADGFSFGPITNVDKVAGDRGCGGHFRRDEVGASAAALAAFEVAITGGGAALAGRQDVGVHAQTHGAAGLPPVK